MSYEAAKKLFDEGLRVIPVHPKSKRPIPSDWRNIVMKSEELEAVFDHECGVNIGVILGGASSAVIEVDIDSKKAASIADLFLPLTGRIFGRESKPRSHYVYKCSDPGKTLQYEHPQTKSMIVELRSTGSQTVFPDSTHPTGEKIRYEIGKEGPPSTVSFSKLQQSVSLIATSEILSDVWLEGSRHNIALSFSGLCAKSGIKSEICKKDHRGGLSYVW